MYVDHRLRLFSDNRPCYISGELKQYFAAQRFTHTRDKPYHPMTQRVIERYHRSMTNIQLLDYYYCKDDLIAEIGNFVDYYNHRRHHESLANVTPAGAYTGRAAAILEHRERTKRETINRRRIEYRNAIATKESAS